MKTPVNKVLVFTTIALLAINIVLAVLLWKGKKHRAAGKSRERGDWVVEELQLNDQQKAEHKKLKDAHFTNLKPLYDSITAYRSRLYALIKEQVVNDSLVNYYTHAIGDNHARISSATFQHFKEIRALCNPDQQVKLDTLMQKLVQNMGKRGNRPRPDSSK